MFFATLAMQSTELTVRIRAMGDVGELGGAVSELNCENGKPGAHEDAAANQGSAASRPQGRMPDQQIAAMQSQVMTAVRGAITGVMASRGQGLDLPDLDFDFSTKPFQLPVPVLRAERERALAIPAARPRGRRMVGFAVLTAAALGAAAASGVAATAWQLYGRGALQPTAPQTLALAAIAKDKGVQVPVAANVIVIDPVTVVANAAAETGPTTGLPLSPPPRTALGTQSMPIAARVGTSAALNALPLLSGPAEIEQAQGVTAAVAAPSTPDPHISIQSLLDSGRIKEARRHLLDEKAFEHSGAALTMARSFDPNYLQTLQNADAGPDIAEARHWYQRWYDLAIKDGAVPETIRVDLLLQSLDRAAATQ